VSRRTIFWLVVALAGTVLLAVVGAIVFSLLDKNGALGLISDLEDEVAAYLAIFGLVFADAIVPIFPGETTLTTVQQRRTWGAPLPCSGVWNDRSQPGRKEGADERPR
jgi:uncharacterized membrane protein YdjX (TVP38/TMEM64 family)